MTLTARIRMLGVSANFMSKRNQLLDELSAILEVMDRLRAAQQALMKNRANEQE